MILLVDCLPKLTKNVMTISSSSECSEEVDLSLPSSEVEVQPYRFEPELPATDIDDGSSEEDSSAEISSLNQVGNIEW